MTAMNENSLDQVTTITSIGNKLLPIYGEKQPKTYGYYFTPLTEDEYKKIIKNINKYLKLQGDVYVVNIKYDNKVNCININDIQLIGLINNVRESDIKKYFGVSYEDAQNGVLRNSGITKREYYQNFANERAANGENPKMQEVAEKDNVLMQSIYYPNNVKLLKEFCIDNYNKVPSHGIIYRKHHD